MGDRPFREPIYLRAGKHVLQEIIGPADAVLFLEDWPHTKRDASHEAALKANREAYGGHHPIDGAHDALVNFAQRHGILEDTEAAAACIAPQPGIS